MIPGQVGAAAAVLCGPRHPLSLPCCRSLNHQESLVELSLLPDATGKQDVLSAPLGQPPPKQEGRETEAAERNHEGKAKEKKKQKQKEKRTGKGQEGAQPPSKDKKEPQKPQAKKLGKRPHPESSSEQVGPLGRWPPLTWKASLLEATSSCLATSSWTESS